MTYYIYYINIFAFISVYADIWCMQVYVYVYTYKILFGPNSDGRACGAGPGHNDINPVVNGP